MCLDFWSFKGGPDFWDRFGRGKFVLLLNMHGNENNYSCLSYDIMSGSDVTQFIEMDK